MLMITVAAVWYFLSGDGWGFLWLMEAALRGGKKLYFIPSDVFLAERVYENEVVKK